MGGEENWTVSLCSLAWLAGFVSWWRNKKVSFFSLVSEWENTQKLHFGSIKFKVTPPTSHLLGNEIYGLEFYYNQPVDVWLYVCVWRGGFCKSFHLLIKCFQVNIHTNNNKRWSRHLWQWGRGYTDLILWWGNDSGSQQTDGGIRGQKVSSFLSLLSKVINVSILDVVVIVQSLSCVRLFATMDCSPPGSPVHGISQVRILECVAISSSRESSWPRNRTSVSCISRQILYHWAIREASNMLDTN